MTKWSVHNKWAMRFGIKLTDEDLNWINDFVDFPKKHVPDLFQEYVGHDWGRKREWEKQQQEIIANEKYGYEGVLAVDLHHILDILEEFSNPQKREQMALFDKAAKESTGTSGVVRRFNGKPNHSNSGRIIPASARAIQGSLGKCYYCKQPLANKPFFELSNVNGKNVLVHEECLSHFFQQKVPQPLGSKGRTFNLLDQKQIKNEIVRKALEVGIREEVIKFILENFWEIINDIENST